MDRSIELAKELKAELENEPLIKEYRRIKELVDNDSEINALKKEIALAKTHKYNELHKELLDRYNNHPLIVNYESLKEEVASLLSEISKIVNKK